ncbi:PREDICTED: NAC domain-containing protein 74-like isoform X2 [Fragaria vesca subsp. vesca]|uniref:NAC domain-containing protein 74-like isoform X2 n=1 Tax=Fragaria vesca subsp. vesca TaxID=101020 RepID=UPI0002C353AD|nr:PREDICTED: NAC domain-containing protein 74-like isoform X2 [Fragaria vesca subsp. vesca]
MTTNRSRDETTPLSLPVGFKFHPTEEELVNYYLKKKIHGGNVSEINQIIPFIELCEHKPAELPGLLGTSATEDHDMEWFFFTRNAYKYNKSCRSNRSTKKGFWKITGKERGIKARHSKAVIGKKRTLTFYQGRGEAKKKKTDWVIHEYYLPRNEVVSCSKQTKGDFVICRLKNKADKKDSSVSNEGEPGRGDDGMNQEGNGELLIHQPQPLDDCCSSALSSPASQELEAVLQTNGTSGDCHELQSQLGDSESCLLDRNEVSTCDEDETVSDVYPQLRDPPEENLDSLLCALQPQDYHPPILQSPIYTKPGNVAHPLQPQNDQPSVILQSPIYTKPHHPPILQSPIYTKPGNITHPLQPQNYQPSVILQSPIYTKQGNVSDASLYYGECNNWQSESTKTISTDKVDIPVRHVMSNFENQAPDYRSPEVPHPQTEVNLGSAVHPFQPQDSTVQPLMYIKFGDALHNIDCNELQSSFGDNNFSFTKFLNINSAYQDYYSSDQTAQTPFKDSCQNHWEGSTMG